MNYDSFRRMMQLRQVQARLMLMSKLHNRMVVAEQATINDSDVGVFHASSFSFLQKGNESLNHSIGRGSIFASCLQKDLLV